MALELSYKGLSDQIGVISPNLVRNGSFIADVTTTTRPAGWATTAASGVSLSPGYSSGDPFRGQALTINSSGYIQCDDFISFSGGTEMKGLYQNPINFTICVFIKGSTTSNVVPTSGLKLEVISDNGTTVIATRYFGYTSAYVLTSAVLTLDDSNFSSSYKFKIKLTNLGSDTLFLKLLSLTPGDVVPSFFLPSLITEENFGAFKNKPLTINTGPSSSITYNGSVAQTINVVSKFTTVGAGLSPYSETTGDISLENTGVKALTGTANQVLVNGVTASQIGSVALSLPQAIATTSSPTFTNVTASGQFSTRGTFISGTGRTGGSWTSLGWGKIGLMGSGTGPPSDAEAPSSEPGDFFFRY